MVCTGLKATSASKIANEVMKHLIRHTPFTCISRLLGRRTVLSRQCCADRYRRRRKKPTWRNALRHSTTSAYSLTSPSAQPSCPLSSHPTNSDQLTTRAALTIRYGSGNQLNSRARIAEGKRTRCRLAGLRNPSGMPLVVVTRPIANAFLSACIAGLFKTPRALPVPVQGSAADCSVGSAFPAS
jgi:hypothetical protein